MMRCELIKPSAGSIVQGRAEDEGISREKERGAGTKVTIISRFGKIMRQKPPDGKPHISQKKGYVGHRPNLVNSSWRSVVAQFGSNTANSAKRPRMIGQLGFDCSGHAQAIDGS